MNETGVDYPTIELDGVKYPVKFTRGLMYRLEKAGIKFAPKLTRDGSSCDFSVIVDTLRMAIDYPGTAEELAELIFDKRDEALSILSDGWGKVLLPSLKLRAAAKAAQKQTAAPPLPN